MAERFLTITDAAARLGISTATVRRHLEDFAPVRIGGRVRIPAEALDVDRLPKIAGGSAR
jgi:excisionase family DNA binding protein